MPRKPLIGHHRAACLICGSAQPEVREAKGGRPYVYCTQCDAQTFARNEHQAQQLLGRTVRQDQPAPPSDTPPAPAPDPEPAEQGGWPKW